jgi:DNA gyrase/topoisomerase IV subunit A
MIVHTFESGDNTFLAAEGRTSKIAGMDEASWRRQKTEARLGMIEAALRAVDEWEPIHRAIAVCSSKEEAIAALTGEPFLFERGQAHFVLDLPLRMCLPLARQDMIEEADTLRAQLEIER